MRNEFRDADQFKLSPNLGLDHFHMASSLWFRFYGSAFGPCHFGLAGRFFGRIKRSFASVGM